MSSLEPRGGRRMTRKKREQRAYQLTLATGGFGVVAVVTALLAIVTSFSWLWPIVFIILAAVSFTSLRRTLGR